MEPTSKQRAFANAYRTNGGHAVSAYRACVKRVYPGKRTVEDRAEEMLANPAVARLLLDPDPEPEPVPAAAANGSAANGEAATPAPDFIEGTPEALGDGEYIRVELRKVIKDVHHKERLRAMTLLENMNRASEEAGSRDPVRQMLQTLTPEEQNDLADLVEWLEARDGASA